MHKVHDLIGSVLRKKIRELDSWIHTLETKGHFFDLIKLARTVGGFAHDTDKKALRKQVVNHLKRKRSKLLRRLPEGKDTTGTVQDVKSVKQ